MESDILYLFTRFPLHIGDDDSVGAIDQPVKRERHTGLPVIPGSSLKGVLADGDGYLERSGGKLIIDDERNATKRTESGAALFGLGAGKAKDDPGQRGAVSFGEGQLLSFPVRSAKGCFAWLTSPLCLKRWERASGVELGEIPKVTGENAWFDAETLGHAGEALFEDYVFQHAGAFDLAETLQLSIEVDKLWNELCPKHLVLVSDETLSHFATTACEIAQHVVIDDETGTSKGGLLFNQENVPAETLFFSTLTRLKKTEHKIDIPNPLQIGANATTGLGFCSTQLVPREA